MFDIGFSELMVIGIVALVVIGPERLPKVAKTLGIVFGRLQRYVTQVKSDISREMELAELSKIKTELETAARTFQSDVESKAAETEREIRDAQSSIERQLESDAQAAPAQAAAEPAAPVSAEPPQLELGIEEPQDWKTRKPSSPT